MNKDQAKTLNQDLGKHLMSRIQKEGEFMMTIFVISGKETRVVSGFDPNSSDTKRVVAEFSRHLGQKYNADCIAITAESFVSTIEDASKEEMEDLQRYREKHGTMEGHPLCKEAVFVCTEYGSGSIMSIFPFERNENEDVVEAGKPQVMEDDGLALDGTLTKLLSPKKRLDIPEQVLQRFEQDIDVPVIPTDMLGIYIAPAASKARN